MSVKSELEKTKALEQFKEDTILRAQLSNNEILPGIDEIFCAGWQAASIFFLENVKVSKVKEN